MALVSSQTHGASEHGDDLVGNAKDITAYSAMHKRLPPRRLSAQFFLTQLSLDFELLSSIKSCDDSVPISVSLHRTTLLLST